MTSRISLINEGLYLSLQLPPIKRMELHMFSDDEEGVRSIFERVIDEKSGKKTGFSEQEAAYVRKWIKKSGRYIKQTADHRIDRFDGSCYFTLGSEFFVGS